MKGKSIIDFEEIEQKSIREIAKLNGRKDTKQGLTALAFEVFNKMRYSEDFETLTNLKTNKLHEI